VLRSFILTIIASLSAWPLSKFYNLPELASLLPVAAIGMFFQGSSSMRVHVAQRDMDVRRVMFLELTVQFVGIVTMLIAASIAASPWAPVIAGVVSGATHLTLSFVIFPGPRDRFAWDKSAVREIVLFGKWILASTGLTFAANHLDRFIFGKLAALTMLGFYNQALNLAMIAATVVGQLGSKVFLPFFSGVVGEQGDLPAEYRRARGPVMVAGGWLVSLLVVGGPAAVVFLYPPVYEPSGVMLQLLAVSSWFGLVLDGPNWTALIALGRPRLVALGGLTKLVVMVPGLFVGGAIGRSLTGTEIGAFSGALTGLMLADFSRYAFLTWCARQNGLKDLRLDILLSFSVLATSAIGLGLLRVLDRFVVVDWSNAIHSAVPFVSAARAKGLLDGLFAALVVTALWLPQLRKAWRQRRFGAGA